MEPTTILGLGTLGLNAIGSIWNAYQGKKTSNRNYDMQKATLDYQKYLNNNQIQMQTADALKAGINPLAMNGTGNLNSGSYSNVEASQMDISGLSSIVNTMMSNRTAEKNAQTAAESAKTVAEINAQSQERQTKMKIDADTEAQKNQQNWQSYENWEQRLFEMAENSRNRENARIIANIGATAMVECTKINDELQRYINQVYETDTEGNIIKDENGNPKKISNAVTAQMKQAQKQLQTVLSAESLNESYKRQLQTLQEDLIRVQTEAQKAGIKQNWVKTLTGTIDSVSNLIGAIKGY